ncbi:DUF2079 domain-containing protein [Streptomyces sp. DSM 44917]|uniref:DUF2079 domain-containing protein n=1 Tax=Streptomyces boetiae TaxID=3075541 RepID=A0ABU2L8G2_9ACTN|nr:DUF2079 domain-containing protein [Streptomyces sp. DSM 44917]MDT0307782.1 DUF2079 domain-containing protein [Streptomyces sp. DSM 44917]
MTTTAPKARTPLAPARIPGAEAAGRPYRDPWLLAAGFFVIYATLSVTRYLRHENQSWDLGIFEQVVRSYAHLRAPVSDLKGPDFPILGDHFSPVTALIAPFYRVFPSPVTLLIVQAALFALAVVPVTRACALLLGRARGAALGIAYGLSWGVQRAVDFDFHEICFAVPLIAFALEAVLRERWRAALLWALPLLLVKEDLGLTAAAIAVVVALRARHRSPGTVAPALAVAAGCAVACALIISFLIPAFNAGGDYDYWTKLGEDDGGGGPLALLAPLGEGTGEKFRTLLWVLVPTTGLLALRSPLLVVLLPTLGWRFVSQEPHYWGTDWHYSAVLMPVVTLALADALARSRHSSRPWLRRYAHHLPAAALACAAALCTALPVATLTSADTYRPGPVARAGDRVLAAVPDGAEVASNVRPIAHLTGRCRVFWIGDTGGVTPEYIAYFDPAHTEVSLLRYATERFPEARYRVVAEEAGYWVLRRA